jgi:FKBP-type peptidyl-prolyl cis-trans isomerase
MANHVARTTRVSICGVALAISLSGLTYAQTPAAVADDSTASSASELPAASYSLGLSFATQWREGGLEGTVSTEDLLRGIRAGLGGAPMAAEDRQRASALLHDAYQSWAKRNATSAEQFLATNSKESDVKTTASGLQYQVLKKGGASPPPAPTDRVTVEYRGHLLNGYEFDSTYKRGKPSVVRPNDVIAGWREALAMMPAGATWRLFVPPALAYGLTPPPSIPPNSLLIFDVELVSVDHTPTHAATVAAPAAAPTKH